ncbi:MAG TPA: SAM-dependent methyltransferase [Acetobacteraceae bacterium]|nr:SAM-dependent methyltransferase [Acetobacteraceae bacterium]
MTERLERMDAFMARANAAYYATHDPFADFTTAPEISQVFGELLGLWAAVTWGLLGRPRPVLLVEAGPGRGTLMADALRAVAQVAPDFHAALSLHLIETSPRLRALQAERLPGATWHDRLDTLPHAPLLLLANEFLDALPIRQFVRRGGEWMERFVGPEGFVEVKNTPPPLEGGGWGEGCVQPRTAAVRTPPPGPLPQGEGEGQIHELCEPAQAFMTDLAARCTAHPGAALFLDYGPEHSTPGDSLQAIANGRPADPLSPPGTADLTAHVDFAALAVTARTAGAPVFGPIPQGPFLARLGLFQRTGRLARGQPAARAAALVEAAQRLAEPNRMGRLFKALALCHPGCPPLPGFAD